MLGTGRSRWIAALAAAVAVASCASGCAADAGVRETVDDTESTSLSDAEIAAILMGVHEQRVAQAKAAIPKLSDPAVKAFAQHMASDHAATQEELSQIFEAIGIVPEDSNTAMELRQASNDVSELLEASPQASADADYIDGQIAMHTFVIHTIDKRLTPVARHPELVRALTSTRAQFAAHLEEAEKLQMMLTERKRSAKREEGNMTDTTSKLAPVRGACEGPAC